MRCWAASLKTKLVALLLAASVFALACGGGAEANPERLVPAGSNLIAKVDVAGILDSDAVASVIASFPMDEADPQSLDELLEQAASETGIDFRQISQSVAFFDLSRMDDFGGIIIKGAFDEAAIVEALEEQGSSVDTLAYKGRQVHSFDGGDETSLAFLEGDNVVLGTMEGVKAVIDVQEGDLQGVSGAVPDALDELGQGLLSLAVEIPREDLQDQLSDLVDIPLGDTPFLEDGGLALPAILEPLQDIELLGLAVAQNGQNLALRVNLHFGSEDSASSAGDFLEGTLTLLSGLVPDDDVQELLENLEVSTAGSVLTLRFEATASEIERLVEGLEDF